MKKFEVCKCTVFTETGKNPASVYNKLVDQDRETVGIFDGLQEARECYEKIAVNARYNGGIFQKYEHSCKFIAVCEYNEDGEYISGEEWIEADFPEFKTEGYA